MVVLVVVERMLLVQLEQVPVTPQALHRLKETMAAQGQAALLSEGREAAAHLLQVLMVAAVQATVETVLRPLFPVHLSPTQAVAAAALILLQLAPEERAAVATVALATPIPG
jgi:hypothetical protein